MRKNALFMFSLIFIGCGGTSEIGSPNTGMPTPQEIRSVTPVTLGEVVEVINEIANENPSLERASGDFARLVFNRIKANADRKVNPIMESLFATRLTAEEWSLIWTIDGMRYAEATRNAGDEASALAHSTFPSDLLRPDWQTKSDAFRHSYWNALLSKRCSVEWAIKFTTAHESEDIDGADKQMDLNNNAIGRIVFQTSQDASDVTLAESLKNYPISHEVADIVINSNRLVYIRPVLVGTWNGSVKLPSFGQCGSSSGMASFTFTDPFGEDSDVGGAYQVPYPMKDIRLAQKEALSMAHALTMFSR